MPFLPRDFVIPEPPATDEFMLTPLRVDHLVLDYEAVMSSRDRLWQLFGPVWGWPRADMTLMQDLVDLGWHQKEFQLRSSFDYVVASSDGTRQLGCVYVDPAETEGVDADVWYWARASELANGLEARIEAFLTGWLADAWPFRIVTINGRQVRLPATSEGLR